MVCPGVSRNFKLTFAESEFVAVVNRHMRERRAGLRAQINFRAGARGELLVPRNKISVQVGLDDILDRESVLGGLFEIYPDVALRIDHGRDPFRAQHVGGV